MSQVWANSVSTGSARLILLAIADFADDQGTAYPSVETLAKKSRVSERTVQYCLRELVQSGELAILEGEGRRGCNLYRVQNLRGCKTQQEGVQSTTEGGAMGCTRTVIDPSENRHSPIGPQGGELPFVASPDQAAVNTKPPLLSRVEKLFGRTERRKLSSGEERAWKRGKPVVEETTEEEWAILEWWFALPDKCPGVEYRRTDMAACLNNWHAEIAKARKNKGHAPPAGTPVEPIKPRIPDNLREDIVVLGLKMKCPPIPRAKIWKCRNYSASA